MAVLKENKLTNLKLGFLVNNAGINKPTDFNKIMDSDWDEILAVNLKGPFICAQEAIPAMQRRGRGVVINIGSVSGQYGGPRTAHYAASKAGLISLGQVIARFGAKHNIRCNTIAAGLIVSEMADTGLKSGAVATAAENILLKRLGTREEVAKAVVFLASDESSYITAQTINVNGGLYF
ncbi:MAG: SDR family oxidoreductase [Desulfobacterales bacterium]